MRMTFLHRTPNVWTPALHQPVEGHIITEVGNFNRLRKDSESTYSASDRARELHTALEYSPVLDVYSDCQLLFPRVCYPQAAPKRRTLPPVEYVLLQPELVPCQRTSFIPNFAVLFLEKFQSFKPKGWETVPSAQTWKEKEAWFTNPPTRWGAPMWVRDH